MPNKFIFADEAGCFTFKVQAGASRYFTLCTLATDDCSLSNDLLALRRELVLAGDEGRDKLHATSDKQEVRDRVFAMLADHAFRVDVTLLEKRKAQPQTRKDDPTFYKYAWYFHFKHVGPLLLREGHKLLITAAALGDRKKRAAFKEGVNNTVQQIAPRDRWEVSFIDSMGDPLLWAADYCAWAIQRKWELNDRRSYDLIHPKIATEFDLWVNGNVFYY